MKIKKSLLGTMISAGLITSSLSVVANQYEVSLNLADYEVDTPNISSNKTKGEGSYIVQLKGQSGISKAIDLGELLPSNQLLYVGNRYNSNSANIVAYAAAQRARQTEIAQEIGSINILHNYVHTFNGFSAKLTSAQAAALESHPDVIGVWRDQLQQPTTANTPEFLGLNGANGQHTLDIKGEGVIVGILDTGITPENPSFSDDGSYSDPTALGWSGTCDAGEEAGAGEGGADTFTCNNKLIGARYFSDSFSATYDIQTELGEFISPRDADGHGSHTAGTAAGNEAVPVALFGSEVGTMTGMAPRARVAAYKVCWNSDYVSPEGVNERGCFFGDSMAAIDQAIVDGVDVLNYSIGNSLDLTTPVYRASLDAAAAGVFFAASAGNDGPDAQTVGNLAPWMTTVAASTYDGISATNVVEITNRELAESINFVEGAITAPLIETGDKAGKLVIAEPLQGCFVDETSAPLDNAEEILGNVALIQRGTCAFTEKVERAQLAGASSVIIYSDGRPVTALGGDGAYEIPGGMISTEDGDALNAAITGGEDVTVRLSASAFGDQTEVGNIMADFSSRGVNRSTGDLIKPDITAPGVRILAATTSTPMFGPQGEQARYLQGTSMSSPHIAGLAALLMGENPDWSPAQVKSALMTTAYQSVVKEDASTPADPFDFGAGHVSPVPAMTPGLTYETNYLDYMAFMCGVDNDSFVANQIEGDCSTLAADGFATDPSQLNYPSIAIEELGGVESISRTLTDMTGAGGVYTISVESPAGIDVAVATFDSNGIETDSNDLEVAANGKASFELTFSRAADAIYNQYSHGSITLTGEDGTVVRSPISVRAVPDILINVPDSVSITLNRGRATIPVEMLYSGSTSLDHAGLVAPFGSTRTVSQDADGDFEFNEAGLGVHVYDIPDSKVLRFSLANSLVSVDGADLDIFVYHLDGNWQQVGSSATADSNENVILSDAPAGLYAVFVLGWDLRGEETADYTMLGWVADGAESSTRVLGSSRAIEGRYNNIRLITRGLDPDFLYMGGVTFYNAEGESQGTMVMEVQPQ